MVGRKAGFWDVEHLLRQLSARSDPLEKLTATVDFDIFRPDLYAAPGRRASRYRSAPQRNQRPQNRPRPKKYRLSEGFDYILARRAADLCPRAGRECNQGTEK